MITLHGYASSNYYNIVKHVMLHKGLPFEERLIYSGGDEWLAISPANMVPAITTEDGQHLSETAVICDYLEESYPEVPLYPAAPSARASVRQIMRFSELYMELPCRSLLNYTLFGDAPPDSAKQDVRGAVERGVKAMTRVCRFSPWIAGDSQTMADIYVHYANKVVGVGTAILEWDIFAEIPGMNDWTERMNDSEIARTIEADRVANGPGFEAFMKEYAASVG